MNGIFALKDGLEKMYINLMNMKKKGSFFGKGLFKFILFSLPFFILTISIGMTCPSELFADESFEETAVAVEKPEVTEETSVAENAVTTVNYMESEVDADVDVSDEAVNAESDFDLEYIEVPFLNGLAHSVFRWDFPYSDDFFRESSGVFSIDTARASMGLTVSAFRNNGELIEDQYETYLKAACFEDIYPYGYDRETGVDTISAVIGHKRIDNFDLIAVGYTPTDAQELTSKQTGIPFKEIYNEYWRFAMNCRNFKKRTEKKPRLQRAG